MSAKAVRNVRIGAAALGLGFGAPGGALAQPQDDAALANAPEEKPSPPNDPGSWEKTKEQQDQERAPPLTTNELRQAYPDLQLRVTPPTTFTVFFTSIYPFQTIGVGLGLDVYVLPRLRLGVIATAGGSLAVNESWHASFYGEASVGIVALRWTDQAIATLPLPAARTFRSKRSTFDRLMLGEESPPDDAFMRALVPASHSLELEAGLFSGPYPLYRCTAHCDEPPGLAQPTKEDASLQVALLYAGVRYVYYRWARSERAHFRSLAGFELAVDAIHNPFAPSNADLFNLRDDHPSHNPLGFRVKLRVPAAKCSLDGTCVGIHLMGGYLPSPADGMFSANIEIQ